MIGLILFVGLFVPAVALLVVLMWEDHRDAELRRRLAAAEDGYRRGLQDGLEQGRVEGMSAAMHLRRARITSQRIAAMRGEQ